MSRRRARSAFVMAVLAVLLVTGCGTSGSGSSDSPEVEVPPSLLSAKTVDGTPVGDLGDLVASAGPDDTSLVGGARATDTAGYRRTSGGEEELVLIGAWERSASLVSTGMDYLSDCLDARECHSEPVTFKAARLGGQPEGTVAFSSVFTNQEGERISVKRSYTYLQAEPNFDGTLVMVSIERFGDSDPSDQELQRLTQAQVAKTKDQPS